MMVEAKETWFNAAESVAKEAGVYLKKGLEKSKEIKFEDSQDVKLQADLDSEKLIRDRLSKETQLPIIGEEEGGDSELLKDDQYFWVVDPLDGTYNYLREQPQCCVSIGLMKGTSFVYGVIYDFNQDNLYRGGQNNPLTVNNKDVTPKWANDPSQGCLTTGFPSKFSTALEVRMDFLMKIQNFKKIRMIGSAAMALTSVAVGQTDAYYEESIFLWDIAAGAALIESVGGYVWLKPSASGTPFSFNFWAGGKKDFLPNLSSN